MVRVPAEANRDIERPSLFDDKEEERSGLAFRLARGGSRRGSCDGEKGGRLPGFIEFQRGFGAPLLEG